MVGLAFTAHNRQHVLDDTLAAVKTHTPPDFPVIVVDDGSTPALKAPDWVHLIRHDTPRGIPAAKNACITALIDRNVEHLLLFDEDTRPAAPDWWQPYTDSPEPHLQYSWTKFANGVPVPKMNVLYRDDTLIGYGWSMGCLIYIHRTVIDAVGGYNLAFTPAYEEHAEYSARVHAAGLTSFTHQDVPAMRGKVWAGDEHGAVKRSFSRADITTLVARNEKLRESLAGSTDYVEYRQQRDIILTSFFTSQTDPQRGHTLAPDPQILAPLIDSTSNLVVLHDCFDELPVEHHRISAPLCAYQQRWISQWQWLRDHPDIRFAWLVDATDVIGLNDPFPLQPNTLYAGWENQTVGCEWIRRHSASYPQWVNEHRDRPLLNCGLAGGDRATLMRLCHRMNDLWAEGSRKDPLEEMLYFNMAAYEHPNLITGPTVATPFKSYATTDPVAVWAHK